MKEANRIVVSAFCFLAGFASVSGQMCPTFPCTIDGSQSGEEASAAIVNFLSYADRSSERIFVIARPGKSDTNERKRLSIV